LCVHAKGKGSRGLGGLNPNPPKPVPLTHNTQSSTTANPNSNLFLIDRERGAQKGFLGFGFFLVACVVYTGPHTSHHKWDKGKREQKRREAGHEWPRNHLCSTSFLFLPGGNWVFYFFLTLEKKSKKNKWVITKRITNKTRFPRNQTKTKTKGERKGRDHRAPLRKSGVVPLNTDLSLCLFFALVPPCFLLALFRWKDSTHPPPSSIRLSLGSLFLSGGQVR